MTQQGTAEQAILTCHARVGNKGSKLFESGQEARFGDSSAKVELTGREEPLQVSKRTLSLACELVRQELEQAPHRGKERTKMPPRLRKELATSQRTESSSSNTTVLIPESSLHRNVSIEQPLKRA